MNSLPHRRPSLGVALLLSGLWWIGARATSAQTPTPALLITAEGVAVNDTLTWEQTRRAELTELFSTHVYGRTPDVVIEPSSVEVLEASDTAYGGRALRRQIRLTYTRNDYELPIELLVYLPKGRQPRALVLGYNFYGNHTVTDDPAVVVPSSWTRTSEALGIDSHVPSAAGRGVRAYRWAIDDIVAAGFGLVTVYCGDVDPDRPDFTDGAHRLIDGPPAEPRDSSAWGTLGAWAWGSSEIMDYLGTDSLLGGTPVILFGHSRLGKAALWAGARDDRFAAVISNNSGCGGAALHRPGQGESVAAITESFPHWFADRFDTYADREADLPIDQHALLALVAPRPLYVASASEDDWADPRGEYLATVAAGGVYRLYGHDAPSELAMPAPDEPIVRRLGYHLRSGRHNVTDYDWREFLRWAETELP